MGPIEIILIAFGAFIIILGIFLLIRSIIEARQCEITKLNLPYKATETPCDIAFSSANESSSATSESPASPRHVAYTLGLFSDMHSKNCMISDETIATAFIDNHCDAVLFLGDFSNHHEKPEIAVSRMSAIGKSLKAAHIPFYAVRGNHDTLLTVQDYEACGIHLLENEWDTLSANGVTVALLGLTDTGKKNRIWPDIPLGFDEQSTAAFDYRICAVHNPDYFFKESASIAPHYDYQFSGHLHGGQIHLPFHAEYRLFRKDRLPKEKNIVSGYHEIGDQKLFITRGCGCVLVPLRLNCRPELCIIELQK